MITVRLPAMLQRPGMPAEIGVDAPAHTIEALVLELDARYPGLAGELDDSIFNFAVNDALVLQRARQNPLRAGDVVEIIPMISGGAFMSFMVHSVTASPLSSRASASLRSRAPGVLPRR